MKTNLNTEWFTVKRYPHIGLPLEWKDKRKVCSYITNREKIASHSFFPFIHKTITSRKFRKEYDKDGNLLNEGKRVHLNSKKREIYYASHLDSNIYSYYGFSLNEKYEKILHSKNLEEVVTAYRKIPLIKNTTEKVRNKCNIDFANDIFKYIHDNQQSDLVAITFDIKSFFDTLNHKKLKQAWSKILEESQLPDDHYKVFRNITKFSYVEETELFYLFQNQIVTKSKTGVIRKKKVSKLKYMQNQNAIAFCDKRDIHLIRKKGLIRANKRTDEGRLRDYGICQGSPISAILANIYMLDFDEYINHKINNINGVYRRYSDDMVIICSKEYKDFVINLMEYSIENISKLKIQTNKTQIFHFYQKNRRLVCGQEFDGKLNENSENRNFEYLGFSFDGETVLLKNSTLARYYRKMKLNVRRCKYYSKVINNDTNGKIFKRRLYKQFSYIGSRRSRKYERVRGTTNRWKITHKYNWGNFITYARLAEKTFKNNRVKSQTKNHWKNLNNELDKFK